MSFDVEDFKSPPIPAEYEHNGKVLHMMVDADMMTADFFEGMERLADDYASQSDKQAHKGSGANAWSALSRSAIFFAETLSRVVTSWDLTAKGEPVAPSLKFFRSLPSDRLTKMFECVVNAGSPKAQGSETAPTTSATTDDTSHTPDTPEAGSLPM